MTAPAHTDVKPSSPAQLVRLVAGREISTRIRDKGFLISSAVLLVLIIGVLALQVVAGSGESTSRIGVVGGDRAVEQALQQQGEQLGTVVEVVPLGDETAARSAVEAEDVDAALVSGAGSRPELLVLSAGGQAQTLVQGALASLSVDRQLAEAGVQLDTSPAVDVVPIEDGGEDRTQATIVALLGVGVLYFLFILFGQFVAQGVVEEKSSRVVELLLATMRPWQLLAGKILGLGALGLLQIVVLAVVGVAAALAFGVVDLPGQLIGTVLTLLAWFVLGYAFYAAVFAVAASLVSRQEDLGSVLMPTTIALVAGFLVALQAAQDPTGTLATVTSFVPGLSPMVMPVRQAAGEAAWWEVALSVLLLLAALGVIVRIGGRVYAGALLRTGGRVNLREALRAES
jgi:ABC-2 type transport system permease protein